MSDAVGGSNEVFAAALTATLNPARPEATACERTAPAIAAHTAVVVSEKILTALLPLPVGMGSIKKTELRG